MAHLHAGKQAAHSQADEATSSWSEAGQVATVVRIACAGAVCRRAQVVIEALHTHSTRGRAASSSPQTRSRTWPLIPSSSSSQEPTVAVVGAREGRSSMRDD